MYEARKNTETFKGNQYTKKSGGAQNEHNQKRKRVSEQIADELGIGKETVKRTEKFAKIGKSPKWGLAKKRNQKPQGPLHASGGTEGTGPLHWRR